MNQLLTPTMTSSFRTKHLLPLGLLGTALLASAPRAALAQSKVEASSEAAVVPPSAPAQPISHTFSAKAGALTPAEVYIDIAETYADTSTAFLLIAKVDSFITPHASFGAQGLLAFPSLEDQDFTLANLGATVKLHYPIGTVILRPGIALSYQSSSSDEFDTIQGFSPGAFAELAFPLSPGFSGVMEVGFVSQPVGGNDASEVTFGPTWYLAFGAEFGR